MGRIVEMDPNTTAVIKTKLDGTEHQVDAPIGSSVMRGVVDNNAPRNDARTRQAMFSYHERCENFIATVWFVSHESSAS